MSYSPVNALRFSVAEQARHAREPRTSCCRLHQCVICTCIYVGRKDLCIAQVANSLQAVLADELVGQVSHIACDFPQEQAL